MSPSLLAYIDPGTGSLILQLLLGGVAGIWVAFKVWGKRIKAFFRGEEKQEDNNSSM